MARCVLLPGPDRRNEMTGIDPIAPAASMETAAATSATSTSKADAQKNQFLKLLVAQLKGQNPLEPLDGTQFVTQLAQFSSLEELVGIHSILSDLQQNLQAASTNSKQSTSDGKLFKESSTI